MNIEIFIPHRRTMKLIDQLIDSDKDHFVCSVHINHQSVFLETDGVPSFVGIEYMAQTVSAYNSQHFVQKQKNQIGFLVSIRNYNSSLTYFPIESTLHIHVNPVFIQEQSGSFNCEIYINQEKVSSGMITAYLPNEAELNKIINYGF